MARPRLAFVHQYRDRHGRMRFYFRKAGHRSVPLKGAPGSDEFMAAYAAALAGTPMPVGEARTKPGSLSALVVRYYASAAFIGLAPQTKRTYRNIIDRLRAEHGDKPVAQLQRQNVQFMVDAKAARPSAANNFLKVLRILMRHALDAGLVKADPTQGVRRMRTRGEGFHTWSDEEIAAFEAFYPSGTRERLALALLLFTAQRRSDVVRMGRQNVSAGRISVAQMKTQARLSIPIHPELRRELAKAPKGNLPFLLTAYGRPFTSAGFGNWFSDAARTAGLAKGCSAHGLRKAAARRLAEAGCSAHEIMSITGHKTLAEVARYTVAANQKRLADQAMKANVGADRERRLANRVAKVAKSGNKSLKKGGK